MPIPDIDHLAAMATVLPRVARLPSKPRSVDGLEFAKAPFRRRSFRQVVQKQRLIYVPYPSDGTIDNSSQVCSCRLDKGFGIGLARLLR